MDGYFSLSGALNVSDPSLHDKFSCGHKIDRKAIYFSSPNKVDLFHMHVIAGWKIKMIIEVELNYLQRSRRGQVTSEQ